MAESPVIEETTETEPTKEVAPDDLLAELKAAGVTNATELQNKLKASSEAGNLAFKLGEERREKAELAKRLEALEKRAVPTEEFNDYTERPIDLQGEIARGVEQVLTKREKQQADAQRQMMTKWHTIQNDEDFHLIKPVWDEKLKDPNFVYAVQSGQVDPVQEYTNTLRTYYKGIARRSAETIEKLSGGKVKTPMVEQGANTAAQPEEEETEAIEKEFNTYKEKIEKGGQLSEAEELAALQAAFLK